MLESDREVAKEEARAFRLPQVGSRIRPDSIAVSVLEGVDDGEEDDDDAEEWEGRNGLERRKNRGDGKRHGAGKEGGGRRRAGAAAAVVAHALRRGPLARSSRASDAVPYHPASLVLPALLLTSNPTFLFPPSPKRRRSSDC